MISFANDYSEACSPEILRELSQIYRQQYPGYGEDDYCTAAAEMLREALACDTADIHFLVGGTQTNLSLIAAALRPHEAVVCVPSGHVNVHETGAIEAVGHKLLMLPGKEGKLLASEVDELLTQHHDDPAHEHTAKPKLLYISNTTEIGTLYRRAELKALREVADKWNLYIYLDGARLGSALTAEENDLKFNELPYYCDAFSIGGTKNGLLMGEALVLVADSLKPEFRYIQKQKGAILAKSWLLGLQYKIAFQDGLYWEWAKTANQMAAKLAHGLEQLGLEMAAPPQSNQTFVYIPKAIHARLAENFVYEIQGARPEGYEIRLCTSWATEAWQVEAFLEAVKVALTTLPH